MGQDVKSMDLWSHLLPASFPLLLTVVVAGAAEEPTAIRFENVAESAGIDFILENGANPNKYMVESVPGGVAAFDYDGDGLTDIYFTNGAVVPSLVKDSPKFHNRLYRNDGEMKFTDVTKEAGVAGEGYSIGVAAADYDNDGNVDLFVTGVNRNLLYSNNGSGKFEEVSVSAGIVSDVWSVAGGWFDYDNDGWLDLFVVNYLRWAPELDRFCGDRSKDLRIYCSPTYFDGLPNTLYRNNGDGTFEDVSEKSGIASHVGKGMSVAFADYDQDGLLDAFVTNDTVRNFLFHNEADGTFEEIGLLAGVAFNSDGKAVSSMGADFRDYDNDSLPDINITALTGQTYPLFRNLGGELFEDASHASQLGRLSSKASGWGNGFVDFNNDGHKDLFTANSHVNDRVEDFQATTYLQHNSVFVNLGDGKFQDASASSGLISGDPQAHRGAAFADFNSDGKIDVVVSAIGVRAELWANVSPSVGGWLKVKLTGAEGNRDAIGATVVVGDQTNHMSPSVGYASSSHTAVHFGLGDATTVDVVVRWPAGGAQRLGAIETNQMIRVGEE